MITLTAGSVGICSVLWFALRKEGKAFGFRQRPEFVWPPGGSPDRTLTLTQIGLILNSSLSTDPTSTGRAAPTNGMSLLYFFMLRVPRVEIICILILTRASLQRPYSFPYLFDRGILHGVERYYTPGVWGCKLLK